MTNEEVIKILKSKMDGSIDTSYEWTETIRLAIKALEEKKTGRWIKTIDEDGTEYWLCSKCRCGSDKATNFCPECGSDNRRDS